MTIYEEVGVFSKTAWDSISPVDKTRSGILHSYRSNLGKIDSANIPNYAPPVKK